MKTVLQASEAVEQKEKTWVFMFSWDTLYTGCISFVFPLETARVVKTPTNKCTLLDNFTSENA